MKETGTVVDIKGNRATVKVDKKDECSKCGMCLFPKGASSVEFTAENEKGAKVGDAVIIERKESGKLLGTILVFLVPLLLIGVSVFLGYAVMKNELWILIFSAIFIVSWFLVLAVIDKKLKNSMGFLAQIVAVIENKKEIVAEKATKE